MDVHHPQIWYSIAFGPSLSVEMCRSSWHGERPGAGIAWNWHGTHWNPLESARPESSEPLPPMWPMLDPGLASMLSPRWRTFIGTIGRTASRLICAPWIWANMMEIYPIFSHPERAVGMIPYWPSLMEPWLSYGYGKWWLWGFCRFPTTMVIQNKDDSQWFSIFMIYDAIIWIMYDDLLASIPINTPSAMQNATGRWALWLWSRGRTHLGRFGVLSSTCNRRPVGPIVAKFCIELLAHLAIAFDRQISWGDEDLGAVHHGTFRGKMAGFRGSPEYISSIIYHLSSISIYMCVYL